VGRRLRVPDHLPVRGVTLVDELIGPKGRAFTSEQAYAVRERDGDLLLSAAAGSGKTSVLVERFVRHVLDDGIPPGRILAITFTEKAAGELKQRVRERLLELGERDLARDAEGAWISTVHGFCARLLRGHAVAAGLDPGFTVLDETVARTLRDEAWTAAFSTWLSSGDAALDLAAAFTTDRLRLAVEEVYGALRSAGSTSPRLPVPAPAPAPDPTTLLALRDRAAASLDPGDERATVARAAAALARCREVFDSLGPGEVPEVGLLDQACFKAGQTKALNCDPCLDYLAEHERFAAACAAFRASRAAAELDALLHGYATAYADAKRARSGLDFDDLELLARDLLVASPAVRRAARERFQRVMVDEFQDSNPRQVELFDIVGGAGPEAAPAAEGSAEAALGAEGSPEGGRAEAAAATGGVFLVGDELQSIYGFRHADVEVFRARRAELDAQGCAAALTMNFRSRTPVLDAVNTAFADRFGEGFAPLVPGRDDAGRGVPVEVLVTGSEGWEDVDLGALPRSQAWRHAEARLIAQRVADLVRSEDVAPEDVVVLMRSATDLPVYERALEEAGLQTLAAGGRGYWARQVVRDLCAWLGALANPRDEEQLYGVLASPLVGVSTDALALIARAGRGNAWRVVTRAFGEALPPRPTAPPSAPVADTQAPPPPPPPPAEAEAGLFAPSPGRAPAPADPLPDWLAELVPDADEDVLAEHPPRSSPETGPDKTPETGPDQPPETGEDQTPEVDEDDDGEQAEARLRVDALAAELPGLLGEDDRERLSAFHARFVTERRLLPRLALDDVLRRAIESTDYDLHVLRLPGGARRLANVNKLLRLAAEHERVHGRDVRGLVDRANAELEADARETDAPVELGDARAVRLMTMHASKGLEFPVVVVADLGRRPQADSPALLVDGDRIGLRLPGVAGGKEYGLDYMALRDERRAAESAEEDRVLYVALTRARERLILSGALNVDRWPDVSRNGVPPIAWLAPALAGGGPDAVPTAEEPGTFAGGDGAGAGVRFLINSPATVGTVLRDGSRAPAGADLPPAPPPPIRAPHLPPAVPPPAVRSLSYSALEQWNRCGYRFYLQRVLGLPQEEDRGERAAPAVRTDTGTLDALTRGSIVHDALERTERRDDARAAGELAAAAVRRGIELGEHELADLVRLVAAYHDSPLAARVARAEAVHREHGFVFPLGTALVTGFVDVLAFEADGHALVVDYKSHRPEELGGDLAALVERDYGVQQRVYALAALSGGATSVEVAFAFLEKPADPVTTLYDRTDADRLTAELEELAEGALNGRFEVAAEPHIGLCAGCPGRSALCVHDETLTGRELPVVAGD
jgi:ATP-dependent exoDNAse (exonuclease V) beta subunit